MQKALLLLFQSFCSVQPYRLAIQGRLASLGILFVQLGAISVLCSLFFVAIVLQLRYVELRPVIDHFPVMTIDSENGAILDQDAPVVLKGNSGILSRLLLKSTNKSAAVFGVYIDTNRKSKSFVSKGEDKNLRFYSAYRDYTFVFARDAVLLNSATANVTRLPYRDFDLDIKTSPGFFAFITIYAVLSAIFGGFSVVVVLYAILVPLMLWKILLGSFIAAFLMVKGTTEQINWRAIFACGFLLSLPSGLVFGALSFLLHPWMLPWPIFYIVLGAGLTIFLMKADKKLQTIPAPPLPPGDER